MKRIILVVFTLVGFFFLSPGTVNAQTFGCIYDGPTNTCKPNINQCGAGYSAESDPCAQYNNSFGLCTASEHQNNACTKVVGFGDEGQECRADGSCNSSDLTCSDSLVCVKKNSSDGGSSGKVCGVDTFKNKVTYCSISPINREIVPNYSGCKGIGEQCLTDLSPTPECSGFQTIESKLSIRAVANGCDPNSTYKVEINSVNGGAEVSGKPDANGHLEIPFNLQQYGNYSFILYNSTKGGTSLGNVSSNIQEIGGGSSHSGGGTGASTGDVKCSDGNSIDTAIGCVPIGNQNALIGFFLKWGIGIGGGIAFLLIVVAGFQIMTSRGDPNRLKAGQELMTSAIAGILLLIFSLVILKIIGYDILGIGAFL
jgi:hypothetical protein